MFFKTKSNITNTSSQYRGTSTQKQPEGNGTLSLPELRRIVAEMVG